MEQRTPSQAPRASAIKENDEWRSSSPGVAHQSLLEGQREEVGFGSMSNVFPQPETRPIILALSRGEGDCRGTSGEPPNGLERERLYSSKAGIRWM
jgi:hypothetical protein